MAPVTRREQRDHTVAWRELEASLPGDAPGLFAASDAAACPEPVRRYLGAAVADGTPRAPAARLWMRGRIKLGRWAPFRARQLLAPRFGTVWEARVAGVVSGSDHYVAGTGAMAWRLLGLFPVVRAAGPDVTRSAAGRVAGESVWVPTALAPPGGAAWRAVADDRIATDVRIDGHTISVEHRLDGAGRVLSSRFQRWGDPDRTGSFARHPFGLETSAWRSFGSVTVPSAGTVGWHHGTDRWEAGAFFRFEITRYELVAGRPGS